MPIHGLDAVCTKHTASHTARNDKDIACHPKASKHLGLAWHNGPFNSNYAHIQLAGLVEQQKILAFFFVHTPLHLGIDDLCRIHSGREKNVEELKILATTSSLYERKKIAKDHPVGAFSTFNNHSIVNTESLPCC